MAFQHQHLPLQFRSSAYLLSGSSSHACGGCIRNGASQPNVAPRSLDPNESTVSESGRHPGAPGSSAERIGSGEVAIGSPAYSTTFRHPPHDSLRCGAYPSDRGDPASGGSGTPPVCGVLAEKNARRTLVAELVKRPLQDLLVQLPCRPRPTGGRTLLGWLAYRAVQDLLVVIE